METKLILQSKLSPGDILTLTVAVASLHTTHPGEYITDVRTPCKAIWENNPYITPLEENDSEVAIVQCHYPSIQRSNQELVPFLYGYLKDLSIQLGVEIEPCSNHPLLYLSDDEKKWINQVHEQVGKNIPYWIVNAGCKRDFTCKQWPIEYYQSVIDKTRGKIQWVQIGGNQHEHHPLRGVINLVGKTDDRQLIRLVYHSQGGLGPITFLQHLCAAFDKPYLCIIGGREPLAWTTYPKQISFHTIGQMPCCLDIACWKSRVVPLHDNNVTLNDNICELPVMSFMKPVAKCMANITPEEIVVVLRRILMSKI